METLERSSLTEDGTWVDVERTFRVRRPVEEAGFGKQVLQSLIDLVIFVLSFTVLPSLVYNLFDIDLARFLPVTFPGIFYFLIASGVFKMTIGNWVTRTRYINEYGDEVRNGFIVLWLTIARFYTFFLDSDKSTFIVSLEELAKIRRIIAREQLPDDEHQWQLPG